MSSMDRFVRWLTGEEVEGEEQARMEETRSAGQAVDNSGLPKLESNAEAYGVTVEPVTVAPGTSYWRATRVHHLSPQENGGRHHLYLDAIKADGGRSFNSQAHITWEGGEQIVTVDKPINEPGTNFPMFKWQKCSVEMLGMPSDKVHGISSSHPDENNPDGSQSGNTLFHHSFLIIFQEVVAPQIVTTGAIQGRVENSQEGLTVELVRTGRIVASAPVESDSTFRFAAVEPGDYLLGLEDQSTPVQVQAGKTVEVLFSLALPASESTIDGTIHGGGGLTLQLLLRAEIMAEGALGQSGSFRLRNLGPGEYHIQVLRPGETDPVAKSGPLVMDGHNRRTVGLTVPIETPEPEPVTPGVQPAPPSLSGSPLDHYVLFSTTDSPNNRAQLSALLPQLALKNLGFGFDHLEAARAKTVTVIGDENSIPESLLVSLSNQGVNVRRLTGMPEEIAAQL